MGDTDVSVALQQKAMTLIRRSLRGADGDWAHSRAIENAIFSQAHGKQRPYARKVRQLAFNLAQNGNLRSALLDGRLNPAQLVQLSSDQLNPAIRADQHRREQERERFMAWVRDVFLAGKEPGPANRCRKCRSSNVDSYQLQTRSADEGMTSYFTCGDCGHRWKAQ